MSSEQQHGDQASSPMAELKAQCELLQQSIQRLEEEKKRAVEAVAAQEAELNVYRRMFRDWAMEQFKEEDWKDFAEADYTIDLEDVIAELEQQQGS